MPSTTVLDRGGPCSFCTNPLPVGRAVVFCPHCGMNVTLAHCPACSSEVEPGWHYCVTCGRDVSALPQISGTATVNTDA